MATIQELEKRIAIIEERNNRVEFDKRWEMSWIRKIILMGCTYIAIGFYLRVISVPDPWLNAIVPAVGFFLSTLSLPIIKNIWTRSVSKN